MDWSKVNAMATAECDQLVEMFEDCLKHFIGERELDSPSPLSLYLDSHVATNCLSLYQNFIQFEASRGNVDKALAVLSNIVASCPDNPQLWMLQAR